MAEDYYRVEAVHGSELSFPVRKRDALDQLAARMELEKLGDPLRVVRLRYRLDPEQPPGQLGDGFTAPIRRVWRGTVIRFPDIGSLGVFVCKPLQHGRGGGNAADWSAALDADTDAKLIAYLWDVFDFERKAGIDFEHSNGRDGLPVSEVIFRDKIATRSAGWTIRPYSGTFHASHVHTSGFPLLPPGPCD